MSIDSKLVLKLRQATSAGFLDCKKAIDEANGNFDEAIKILREKGIAKAIKKADRAAQEGITFFIAKNNYAIGLVFNCETDFVAKNEKFLNLCHEIGNFALNNFQLKSLSKLLLAKISDISVEKYILQISSTLGENVKLSEVLFLDKNDNEIFGIYNHVNNKISALTIIKGGDLEVAKNLAMHISALNPTFISINDIDKKIVDNEKAILLENALNENKTAVKPLPENIINKKIEGRLQKTLGEKCLLEQMYVKEPNLKVSAYLNNHKAQIIKFIYLIIK